MGEIFIEGLGTVEIEGEVPTDEESQAILEAVQDPDDEGDPLVSAEPAAPTAPGPESEPVEGPLGLMPGEFRQPIRETIERQPGLVQLLAEMSPAMIGTGVGVGVGASVGGPVGAFLGGPVGGFLGETVGQEIGISPRSDLNLALSTFGPVVGSAVGKGLQLARRGVGTAFVKGFPAARVARSRNVMGRAVSETESLGTTILNSRKGLMARSADDLFAAMRRSRVRIRPELLSNTRTAISEKITELKPLSSIPEVNQTIKALNQVSNVMLNNKSGALLDEVIRARSFVGDIIGRLSSKGGIKAGTAKKIFAAMNDDLDRIATSPFRKGAQTRLAKAGISRAKLEFAVKDLEAGVARFVSDVPNVPGGVQINFKGLQKWLRNVTNPKSAQYDKNFVAALSDDLPAIKKRIAEFAKLATTASPGGPGSIVLRGQSSKLGRALLGGALGFLGTGGSAAGAAAGGLMFAQLPEMMVAILTTKPGAAFLERVAVAGRGQISQRAWQIAGEIAFRSLGEFNEKARREKQQDLEKKARVPLSGREARRRIKEREKQRGAKKGSATKKPRQRSKPAPSLP